MENQDRYQLHILQGTVQRSITGNTRLYLRTEPPLADGSIAAGADGQYLGIVVLAPSVPRWMSPYFGDALKAHDDGTKGADLNLYSQDWFEKIVYVPGELMQDDDVRKSLDPYIVPQNLVSHSLSTGCQQITAQTRILPVVFDGHNLTTAPALFGNSQTAYYAIVSKHVGNDMTQMAEITVTTLDNVGNFAASDLHKQRLADSYILRHNAVVEGTIPAKRCKVFDAVRASHHAP